MKLTNPHSRRLSRIVTSVSGDQRSVYNVATTLADEYMAITVEECLVISLSYRFLSIVSVAAISSCMFRQAIPDSGAHLKVSRLCINPLSALTLEHKLS